MDSAHSLGRLVDQGAGQFRRDPVDPGCRAHQEAGVQDEIGLCHDISNRRRVTQGADLGSVSAKADDWATARDASGPVGVGRVGATAREAGFDIARGLAMILVVLGHALIGAMNAGFDDRVLRALLLVIYSSHMALFFTVSGLLSGGMARRGWPDFAQAMCARILWPYALWSVVLLAAHHVMSGYTNAPLDVFEPWTILWAPPAIMWFLYVLFFALVMMRGLAPAGAGVMSLAGLGLMVMAYAAPEVPPNLRFAGLFLIAASIGPGAWVRVRPVWIGLACSVMVGTLWLAIKDSAAPITGYPAAGLAYVPALVAGPLTLLTVARGLGRTGLGPLLAYVGQRTMPIFVTHILITAGVRILARAAGVEGWWLIIALATGLGVALPLIALALSDRLRMSNWLGWR